MMSESGEGASQSHGKLSKCESLHLSLDINCLERGAVGGAGPKGLKVWPFFNILLSIASKHVNCIEIYRIYQRYVEYLHTLKCILPVNIIDQ